MGTGSGKPEVPRIQPQVATYQRDRSRGRGTEPEAQKIEGGERDYLGQTEKETAEIRGEEPAPGENPDPVKDNPYALNILPGRHREEESEKEVHIWKYYKTGPVICQIKDRMKQSIS